MPAAAVENGQHSAGLLVSRREWSAGDYDGAGSRSSEALSAMASSAPGAAGARGSALLAEDGGGSPEGGTPVHGPRPQVNMYDHLPRDD
jgi:hypothetical protein